MKNFQITFDVLNNYNDGTCYLRFIPSDPVIASTCIVSTGDRVPYSGNDEETIAQNTAKFAQNMWAVFNQTYNDGTWQLDPKYI